MLTGRPIQDWREVHLALPPAHLRTACGIDVKGHFRLRDEAPVTCPACLKVLALDAELDKQEWPEYAAAIHADANGPDFTPSDFDCGLGEVDCGGE